MLATSNEQLVVDFLAAMGRADIDALSDMLADDATWWLAGDLPVSGLYRGKPAVIGEFLWSAAALFEPGSLGFELRGTIIAAGTVIAEYIGTGRGLNGGKPYRNTYCTSSNVAADKSAPCASTSTPHTHERHSTQIARHTMSAVDRSRTWFYWLVPATFLAHCAEELPRFPKWATKHFGTTTTQFYIASHAVIIPALVGASARGARRPSDSRAAFLATTVSAGLGINAIFHIATTALFREYSPGVVTGAAGMLPAALYTVYRTKRSRILNDEQIVAAVLTGTAITTAVVGSLYINMPRLGGTVATD